MGLLVLDGSVAWSEDSLPYHPLSRCTAGKSPSERLSLECTTTRVGLERRRQHTVWQQSLHMG
eukprot:m.381874 g.381874  ORF g.381874 m.381874 type:complete len:63 (+) comp16717_c1_seq1:2-190(+)